MSNAPGLDMTDYVSSSSDHLTVDDFASGPRVLSITETGPTGQTGKGSRPVYILFEGEPLAFLPSLTCRRILARIWTAEDNKRANKTYPGRSLRLFVDPEVTYGEKGKGVIKVGGIRINGATHIDKTVTGTTVSGRNKRAPFRVEPIQPPQPAGPPIAERIANATQALEQSAPLRLAALRDEFGIASDLTRASPDTLKRWFLALVELHKSVQGGGE